MSTMVKPPAGPKVGSMAVRLGGSPTGAPMSIGKALLSDAWPVAFELSPRARQGTVRIARATHRPPDATYIRGPLPALLGLFDGSVDADSAFFSRDIVVEGDIQAVMALHNALEAADLALADLLCLSPPSSNLANSGMALILRRLKAFRQAASAR